MAKTTKPRKRLSFNRKEVLDITYSYSLDKLERTITGRLLSDSDEFNNLVFAGFDHAFPHTLSLFFVPDFSILSLDSTRAGNDRAAIVEEYCKVQKQRDTAHQKKQIEKIVKCDKKCAEIGNRLISIDKTKEEKTEKVRSIVETMQSLEGMVG